MEIGVLVRGGGLFLAAFALHWTLWRLRGAPKAPALTLSLHFLAFGAAYAVWGPRGSRFDQGAVLLLYVALAAAYVQTMPLLLLRSPTLQLLLDLEKAGAPGLSREDLARAFDARTLFSRRIEELLAAGLVEESGDGLLRSRLRGKLAVPGFLALRRVLGLPASLG